MGRTTNRGIGAAGSALCAVLALAAAVVPSPAAAATGNRAASSMARASTRHAAPARRPSPVTGRPRAASGRPRAATTTTSNPAPATPAPTPPVQPRPANGTARLYLRDLYWVQRSPVTIPGRAVKVAGVVWPYVPHQSVTVKAYLAGRLFKTLQRRLIRSRNGTFGYFSVFVTSPDVGEVTVRVLHRADSTMSWFSVSKHFAALDERIGFGSTGRFVQLVQQRLAALHFFLRQSGVYDGGMGQAIDAYHRLLGWGTSQTLDARTAAALLNGQGDFRIRYPRQGRHAEGWINKQLLALADGSKVQYIFPISSGKPSTPTILGSFHVYVQTPGYLPDGMYYSSFFIGGYAIHGYDPAPDWPASHGCMRTQISVARFIYHWLTVGDAVDTYL